MELQEILMRTMFPLADVWDLGAALYRRLQKDPPKEDSKKSKLSPTQDIMIKHLKCLTLLAVVTGGLSRKGGKVKPEKIRPVTTRDTFRLNGTDYNVTVYKDGEIHVNGRKWHLHGTGANFNVQRFQFDPDREEIVIKAEGYLPVYTKSFQGVFSKDKIQQILPHLIGSQDSLKLMALKAPFGAEYTITLEPGPKA